MITVVTKQSGLEGWRGRKVESVIRRVYGKNAFVWWSSVPGAGFAGTVVKPGKHGGYIVLDRVFSVE